MKFIFTLTVLLFNFAVGAQNPIPPPGPGDNDLNGPRNSDLCNIGCFAGCSPISPACQEKRLNIIEEAIQDNEFNDNNTEINLQFDNSIVNIVESKSLDLNTVHILFKSKLSNETVSAVITTTNSRGKNQTLSSITTINLPKGQIVMSRDSMKLITVNEVVEISLTESLSKNDFYEMERFQKVYSDLVNESDFLEFNLILSEFNSEDKSLGCFGASATLLGASVYLAGVSAATYLTAGAAAAAIGPAIIAVGTATIAVDMLCFGGGSTAQQ